MTNRIIGHLKRRLRTIEAEISRLKIAIADARTDIKIREDTLFAYKVEWHSLNRTLKSWTPEPEENDNDTVVN